MKEEFVNPLGVDKISTLVRKFSIPAIIGMMVNALYNIVDRIFIGNSEKLGANGLAAITISFPLMILLIAFGVLFGIGGATLFSMKLGDEKKEEAEQALGNAFVLLVISGILLTVFGEIYMKDILYLFGSSDMIYPYAKEYATIILVGAVFQITGMGMNNFMRADGNPKLAMLTMFFGAGTNIILDPIFIFGFDMGMSGAALATILSQTISFVWVTWYFISKKSQNKIKLAYMKLKWNVTIKIIMLGLPNFFLQLANSMLNTILNNGLRQYGGDIAVSTMGVINSIQTLILMPIIGLNQGVQPIISFNFGARKLERVKNAVLLAIKVATSIVVAGYLMIRIMPSQLIRMFSNDAELIEFGVFALQAWLFFLPLIGFQIIAANFFQAIGKAKSAMLLTLTRQLILLIPALLILPHFYGLQGILYAAPCADLGATIITFIWFGLEMKRMSNISKEEKVVEV